MNKILSLFFLLFVTQTPIAAQELKKVFISKVVQHAALDLTAKGIVAGLSEHGYKQGINLDLRLECAQASPAIASQIASKFINQKPDVVVGLGTISAQSFLRYAKENKVKLVFSSVTDPMKADLVQSLESPSNNTSGVSNFVAIEPQLALFQKIQPNLKRLGFLYNPSELNSLSLIKTLQQICPSFGITLVLQAAYKTADISQAATKLSSQVDAIFISNDSTALSALQAIISASNKVGIPVYVSDTAAVKLGAVAALGPNQYEIGLQTGAMIARALQGENLNSMPVEFPTHTELYLNMDAAKKSGIIFSQELKDSASKIINTSSL